MIVSNRADLHTHSNHSDGSFTPQEIIQRASQFGLKAISITDHDNISAIPVATSVCREYNIEFIPGVEISAQYKKYEIHLLGYFFDYENKKLNEYINFFQQHRKKRAKKIIQKLWQLGIKIELDAVIKRALPGSVGRPHIATEMFEQDYVQSYEEAFRRYLGDFCPCFEPKYKLSPAEAIQLICQAGGVSFIAHPGSEINDHCILEFMKMGLNGIETVHPRHTAHQAAYFRSLVNKHDLLACGGSDCHGDHERETLLGKLTIPYQLVTNMKKWLGRIGTE